MRYASSKFLQEYLVPPLFDVTKYFLYDLFKYRFGSILGTYINSTIRLLFNKPSSSCWIVVMSAIFLSVTWVVLQSMSMKVIVHIVIVLGSEIE